ncbi:hypothetical protein [cf. Phormidesmis sp. LEGE 11477]|uniref:hypothetical protein n=1 Tax=cf. Phormidesmis sp. LEGE 11477 TaxID=1828680 RepID=UPI00187E0E13|nr:hypothetical protein [cf. Phormidesmis sp. LEGE 11477]MBE9062946.1 hypothetical protein [cf. Phormidesmis sp. LEGE 11477]
MKPSSYTESSQSASTRYAPSVPMSVHRELAAELRANKAVIDSLNNRNEQLLKQNQRLKQEIHHVVQAALTLGQAAGVARPATRDSLYSGSRNDLSRNDLQGDTQAPLADSAVPNSLASLVQAQSEKRSEKQSEKQRSERQNARNAGLPTPTDEAITLYEPLVAPTQPAASKVAPKSARNRVPKPIGEGQPVGRLGQRQPSKSARNTGAQRQKKPQLGSQFSTIMPKLFTEQSGSYRSSILEKGEEQEIGGIWLVFSIVLIIVTAFGAGFLIMKPLLGDR